MVKSREDLQELVLAAGYVKHEAERALAGRQHALPYALNLLQAVANTDGVEQASATPAISTAEAIRQLPIMDAIIEKANRRVEAPCPFCDDFKSP